MRALQAIGMGLLIVLIRAGSGPDLLLDPLGWLLVLYGVRRLPADLPLRTAVSVLGTLALVVSVPLSVPKGAERVLDADPSLQWAVNLPQLLFVTTLASALGRRAGDHGDAAGRGWWFLVATLTGVSAAAPVLVFGGGVTALEAPALVLAGAVLLTAIVLCFAHSGRPWTASAASQAPPSHPTSG